MTHTDNIIAHVRGIVSSYDDGSPCDQSRRMILADYLSDIGYDIAASTQRYLAAEGKYPLRYPMYNGFWDFNRFGTIIPRRHYWVLPFHIYPTQVDFRNADTIDDLILCELALITVNKEILTCVENWKLSAPPTIHYGRLHSLTYSVARGG